MSSVDRKRKRSEDPLVTSRGSPRSPEKTSEDPPSEPKTESPSEDKNVETSSIAIEAKDSSGDSRLNAFPSTTSAVEFFTRLQEVESRKEKVGTVHAKRKDPLSKESSSNKGDWSCSKCGTANYKHSIQCTRCYAMKRISEYR